MSDIGLVSYTEEWDHIDPEPTNWLPVWLGAALCGIVLFGSATWLRWTAPPIVDFPTPRVPYVAAVPPVLFELPADEPAITWTGNGWHEGKGWIFRSLIIDPTTHTVTANCPKETK